ncbi:YwqG family protein [Lysinibacillus antri]|uniref:YwqG family protein n=1 Tax=Lysinibacillus antri TaxID=2498145 RepID=UPI001319F74E|nr:YwqG family protein [Lysinibacillus antri]
METKDFINLPHQMERFRDKLVPSLLKNTLITPYRRITSPTESKFAGYPYLPKTHVHPKDLKGNYMHLLAQINFSDSIFLPPFPEKGILQIFISKDLCFPEAQVKELYFQQEFKIRYYPSILPEGELVQDFSYLSNLGSDFPIQNEMGLIFSDHMEPVTATDYRLKQYLGFPLSDYGHISDDEQTLEDLYFETYLGAEHKIGGYPYFIEEDSRTNSEFLKRFDTLLLQIVTNDEQGIVYGDTGIIKVFINREKLMKLDFTEVYFHAEQY